MTASVTLPALESHASLSDHLKQNKDIDFKGVLDWFRQTKDGNPKHYLHSKVNIMNEF